MVIALECESGLKLGQKSCSGLMSPSPKDAGNGPPAEHGADTGPQRYVVLRLVAVGRMGAWLTGWLMSSWWAPSRRG